MKTQRLKMFIGLFLLAFVALSAACSSAPATTAQTPRIKSAESPTPEYKPLKRVSRDVIKSETKEDVVKVKAK
jgi:ABC-type glycerol-3-phosphate transport system substrate-binding protein